MTELLSYPFFIRALIASLLISISCGIIGSYIVSKRIVFISGGITHSSFGGIGIGYYFGFNPVLGAAIFAVLSAFSIEVLSKRAKMRTDSLIGILWSFGMAVGIIFVFITPGYAPNLMGYLFGSILTVSVNYLWIMALLSIIIILFFIFMFKEILFVAFDEEYAITQGVQVKSINYILLVLISLTIVISIKIVGIILVISMLTIPQAIAGLFTNEFKKIIILSIGFGLLTCLSGLTVSYYLEIPSGASIIFSSAIIFVLLKVYMIIKNKIRSSR